ncbi:PAS domain S-box protein [Flavobacteriaceae bacterium]|nr:PAS domain S-box protein [Flavobacteriaceae bacterium]MDC1393642.1 PAS domain S-box protein [Flavobacteriaceae bacterium]
MSKQEIELLQRALDRQVKARKEAEKILESKSKELYDTLHYLREDNNRLKGLLQEKTSELEGVFFNIPDPYLVINLKGQVIKMNQAAKLFLGFDTDKEDFYAAQLVHHEYLMATLQSFGLLQEVGILKNFKTKINIKSGGSRFVQVNANLIYDASGMPIAAQGVLRDVTNEEEVSAILEEQKEALKDSQKRLEAVISDLQAQKEKYSSIIANMNLGLVEVDNEDLVQLVNKSFCTLSGYTEKELYGNKLGQLLHVSDPKIILVHQKNRLKGISDTYEVNVQVKGGQKKHWLISGAPRYNEKGQVIGSIGIHLDITEQYELSEQKEQLLKDLESSNEGLQEYAHIVSHDLKSPLRSISALASWLEEDFGDKLGPAGLSQLNLMQDKIASMDQLITGILRYSSIGSEKARFEICPTLELIQQLKATIYWPEQIALRFNGTMPSIKADKTQLQQLFQNLLSNAISHMDKPKGQIEIGYNDLGDLHEFSVKDNGIGIPKAYKEKIFEIFETLESGKGSSGIGLSIVKKIVQLHGGTIWVKSEYGAGATFYFTIKKDIS